MKVYSKNTNFKLTVFCHITHWNLSYIHIPYTDSIYLTAEQKEQFMKYTGVFPYIMKCCAVDKDQLIIPQTPRPYAGPVF